MANQNFNTVPNFTHEKYQQWAEESKTNPLEVTVVWIDGEWLEDSVPFPFLFKPCFNGEWDIFVSLDFLCLLSFTDEEDFEKFTNKDFDTYGVKGLELQVYQTNDDTCPEVLAVPFPIAIDYFFYQIERGYSGHAFPLKRLTIALLTRFVQEGITKKKYAERAKHHSAEIVKAIEQKEQGKKAPSKGYIYFVQNKNTKSIKIGYSADVKNRIKALQTSTDGELSVLKYCKGTLQEERNLHKRFREIRISGEWFHPSTELLGFIESVS